MIQAVGLGKRYRTRWALRDCGFEVAAGTVTALVGANGAGKTTLLRTLAGLLPPDEGEVRGGARVGFVAQEKPLYAGLTPTATLRAVRDLNRKWDQERAERWLTRFAVPLDVRCGRLSTGQRAQVAFAAALGAVPDVLLLDEPLANLDPLARKDVMAELLTEVADTGMAVVLSTHTITDVDTAADRVLVLADGTVRLDSTVDDLIAHHARYAGPEGAEPTWGEVVRSGGTFVVRLPDGPWPRPDGWSARAMSVEDIVLAHLATARDEVAA